MPIFLDTTGKSSLGVGICDRCQQKFPIGELFSDPNSPGLKVCRNDMDEFDPYRLPARQTEDITLRFVRPDVELTDRNTLGENPEYGLMGARQALNPSGPRITEDGAILILEEPFSENVDIG